ncbi:MAG: RDD family protein [Planctomycetes bacterium]|nr:RDD family protein [Planctomycetota bacterium]
MEQKHNPYQSPTSEVTTRTRTGDHKLAGRGSRLMAVIIDSVLLLAVVVPIQWVMGVYDGFPEEMDQGFLSGLMWAAFSFGTMLLLNGYLLATRAQSIGKLALGIKIVTLQGDNADFGRIVLRRILPMMVVGWIPLIGGLASLANGLFIFRQDRRCIHDHIADTQVVIA